MFQYVPLFWVSKSYAILKLQMKKHKLNTQLLSTQGSAFNQSFVRQELPEETSKMASNSIMASSTYAKQTARSRLNTSFACQPPTKSYSPAHSAVSCKQEEYYRSIQWTLINENHNLKEHIDFLSAQIRSMFQRQKRQNDSIKTLKAKCKELQMINVELQQQLYRLTNQTLSEIQRIQNLLNSEKLGVQELLLSSVSKSQQLGSETEVTINNNLQQLKAQISSIITTCSVKKAKVRNQSIQFQLQRLEETKEQINKHPILQFQTSQRNSGDQQEQEYSFYQNLSLKKNSYRQPAFNHHYESNLTNRCNYTKK